MLLKLENPKIFSEVIGIISELVLEARLKVSPEGLSITALDPANVAMVSFRLPAKAFAELNVDKEEVLGVSLENLKAVLRRIRPNTLLILSKEENELKIELIDRIKREFKLSLIDIESEEKEIPNLEFKAKVELPSEEFSQAIEDGLVVADSCTLIAEPDKFVIEAKGPFNSFKIEFSDEANIEAASSRAKYSLEYLQKIIKATKLSEKTIVNFSSDYPLRLDFNNPLIEFSFILAPRGEED